MKKIAYLLFFVTTISCSSVQNYSQNNLDLEYYREKILTFQMTSTGVQHINMEGTYAGSVVQPNFKETFAEAVSEMAEETKLNLKTGVYPESNIDVKVLDANWRFKLSSAELTTKINFHTSFGNYESMGTFKNAGGGSERKDYQKRKYKTLGTVFGRPAKLKQIDIF